MMITRIFLSLTLTVTALPLLANASLVLDPAEFHAGPAAIEAAGQPAGVSVTHAQLGGLQEDGFRPITFKPTATAARINLPLKADDPRAWLQARSLKLHVQNAMPWPVSLQVMISDQNGAALKTQFALLPGPAYTLVIPLAATRALRWGMRSAPPTPFIHDGERLLVASEVTGKIGLDQVSAIELLVPAPDSTQTLRIGKGFLEAKRDDERLLYTEIIDCLGQFSRRNWPGKQAIDSTQNRSAPECAANGLRQRDSNQVSSASKNRTGEVHRDAYGGLILPGWPSGKLASGFFGTYRMPSINQQPGRWLLLTPAGNPFFSLGVNAVQLRNSATFVEGREFMFADLPKPDDPLAVFYARSDSSETLAASAGAQKGRGFGKGRSFDFYQANLYRRYGSTFPRHWTEMSANRLKRWHFNTIGSWSDQDFAQASGLPHTAIIHIEGDFKRLSDGHDWWSGIPDVFDPGFEAAVKATLAPAVSAHRGDPYLLGYFVDNELGWGNGGAADPATRWKLALLVLAMDGYEPEAYAKQAFVKWLQDRYASVDALSKAWETPLTDWRDVVAPLNILNERNLALTAVANDLSALSSLHAERYFSLVGRTLKGLDPDHLYLGARFASRTPEAVAACAKYCDVVSFNLYVPDIESGFEATQFAQHDKPALLSEFHFGSADRGPFWAGVMTVAREQDRSPAYKKMLTSVLANPQFVGAHWFQFLDQPATGRWLDGENGHLGLIDITDAPWPEFVQGVTQANQAVLESLAGRLR